MGDHLIFQQVVLGLHGRGQSGRVMVGSGRALTPVDDPHDGEKLGGQKGGIEGNGVRDRDSRLDVSGATVMDGEEERQEARLNVVFGIERKCCLRQQGSAVADRRVFGFLFVTR